MTALSLYESAVHSNNNGVLLFEQGNFVRARSFFKKAIALMAKAVIEHSRDSNIDDPKKQRSFDAKEDRKEHQFVEWSKNAKVPMGSSQQQSFAFRRAIRIVQTSMPSTRPSENLFADETAALVYNMGLSFHLEWITRNISKRMRRALKCYDSCQRLRRRQGGLGEDLSILDLAVSNNMGQIYHELVDFKTARQFFDQLSTCLIRLHKEQRRETACLTSQDFGGFMLNVTMESPMLGAAA